MQAAPPEQEVAPLAQRLQRAVGSIYQVGPMLGRGGMGVVFRATDTRLRRDVAIKALLPELGLSPEFRARLVREAQMVASLAHPHIVPIHDVGETEDMVWFAMAFIDGESARNRVERSGPMSPPAVASVLQGAAQALAYAHARGVVHRDVNPDNLMMENESDRPLLMDFGIARSDREIGMTTPGTIIGTGRYMAPEQALGMPVDARADQYSLALVGYFLIAGADAIQVNSFPELVTRHVRGEPVDLSPITGKVRPPFQAALARALTSAPEGRFPRMEAFHEAISESGEVRRQIPAPARTLIRESERIIVMMGFGAMAVSMMGIVNAPVPFLIAIFGLMVVNWVSMLERVRSGGLMWPALREGLLAEREARAEERNVRTPMFGGPLTWIAAALVFACLLLAMLLQHGSRQRTGWDMLLAIGGTNVLVTFVPGVRNRMIPSAARARIIGIGCILVAVMQVLDKPAPLKAVLNGTASARDTLLALGNPVLALAGLCVLGAWLLSRRNSAESDRLPRWLERLGPRIFPDAPRKV